MASACVCAVSRHPGHGANVETLWHAVDISVAAGSAGRGPFLSGAACLQDSKGAGSAGGDPYSSLTPKEEVKESLGKKKKGQKQQTLLFTTAQRRY